MTEAAKVILTDREPRALVYHLLARLFSYPEADFYKQLASGDWSLQLETALERTGFSGGLEFAVSLPEKDDYESQYIALFEVGMGGAPCPLHSGHYVKDRMKVMEEVLRFYRYFDFIWEKKENRFPDHLAVELDFMACLAGQGSQAGEPTSFLLAQRDFCQRQLMTWVGDFSNRVSRNTPHQCFRESARFLGSFIDYDYQYLEQQLDKTG